jgi:hypothetical protein
MGFLKFVVWTACAVGLGIFLSSAQVDGRTPLQHMERAWKRHVQPSQVERVKDGLRDTLDEAKEAVTQTTKPRPSGPPKERITAEDRAAIQRLIAQKK